MLTKLFANTWDVSIHWLSAAIIIVISIIMDVCKVHISYGDIKDFNNTETEQDSHF